MDLAVDLGLYQQTLADHLNLGLDLLGNNQLHEDDEGLAQQGVLSEPAKCQPSCLGLSKARLAYILLMLIISLAVYVLINEDDDDSPKKAKPRPIPAWYRVLLFIGLSLNFLLVAWLASDVYCRCPDKRTAFNLLLLLYVALVLAWLYLTFAEPRLEAGLTVYLTSLAVWLGVSFHFKLDVWLVSLSLALLSLIGLANIWMVKYCKEKVSPFSERC